MSPQELRQALYPGLFSDYIDDFSTESEALKRLLGLDEPDFRMRDVELVLRYFSYKFFAEQYGGNFKKFLDDTTNQLNSNWKKNKKEIVDSASELNNALEFTRSIFGDKATCRKWTPDGYERRINRAVFDIMIYYFSDEAIRKKAAKKGKTLESAFKSLCEKNADFLSSLETTTKSQEANWTRFGLWSQTLNRTLGTKTKNPIPKPVA